MIWLVYRVENDWHHSTLLTVSYRIPSANAGYCTGTAEHLYMWLWVRCAYCLACFSPSIRPSVRASASQSALRPIKFASISIAIEVKSREQGSQTDRQTVRRTKTQAERQTKRQTGRSELTTSTRYAVASQSQPPTRRTSAWCCPRESPCPRRSLTTSLQVLVLDDLVLDLVLESQSPWKLSRTLHSANSLVMVCMITWSMNSFTAVEHEVAKISLFIYLFIYEFTVAKMTIKYKKGTQYTWNQMQL